MLCKLRGCVYGAIWYWLPKVARRLGVLGVLGESLLLFAANVNTLGSDCSVVPADCGGVNVNEVAEGWDSAGTARGVEPEIAELGVSG